MAPTLSWPPPTKGFPRSHSPSQPPSHGTDGGRKPPEKALDFVDAGTPGDGAPRPTVEHVRRNLAARTAEVTDQHPRPSLAEETTPSALPGAAAPASTHRAHPAET